MDFLGLGEGGPARSRARVVVLPAPYEGTTSYQKGTAGGPAALIAASAQVELYDEVLGVETHQAVGIHTADPIRFGPDPKEAVESVRTSVAGILDEGRFPLLLGGEHTVSVGALWACADRFGTITVVQIDAHADLRESYEGSPFSHACVAARMLDREGVRLVQVGIRNSSAPEAARIRDDDRVRTCWAHEIRGNRNWIDEVVASLEGPVYVTVDLDGLDPSVCPGTGTPEPGGLSWYEVTDLLAAVARKSRVVGMDIVELMPIPGQAVSEFAAAKLAYRGIGLFAAGDRVSIVDGS